MKIVRYSNAQGQICYGILHPAGAITRAEGDPYSELRDSGELAEVPQTARPRAGDRHSLHRPELPQARRGREQADSRVSRAVHEDLRGRAKSRRPDRPAAQLRSDEVDYECELAVVIGKPCKNVSQGRTRSTTCSATPAPTTCRPATGNNSGAAASGAAARRSTPSPRSARAS